MFAVNLVVALALAVVVWYVASRGAAQLIFTAEVRRPRIIGRPLWGAFEAALTLAVFLFSVGIWIGLTYLLERINR